MELLTVAIKCIDGAILDGDCLVVDPLLKVIEKLDRYHGLAWTHAPAAPAPARLQAAAAPLALADARDSKDQSIP